MNPWTLLQSLIGTILNVAYQIIPNYGVAIILMTLFISLLLFPLTLKQTRSMKAMQDIQPEVKRLQKDLKGDREELNKQLMELYKERGVNPAAGCLPLIIQMPIWFALFSVLRTGSGIPDGDLLTVMTEAREAFEAGVPYGDPVYDAVSFLGMNLMASPSRVVPDLVTSGNILAAVPYILLIILIVAAGFYQQMQGMQTAMKIMPIFFGFISWTMTAGLGLYFATSNLFRVGQQALILRLDDPGRGQKKKGSEAPPEPDADEDPKKKSSPSANASKKRKRRKRK